MSAEKLSYYQVMSNPGDPDYIVRRILVNVEQAKFNFMEVRRSIAKYLTEAGDKDELFAQIQKNIQALDANLQWIKDDSETLVTRG